MPLTPSDPTVAAVPASEERALDTVHITEFRAILKPNDPTNPAVVVNYQMGYVDGESEFIPVRGGQKVFRGATALQAMGSPPNGGTVYDVVKNAVYQLLIDAGEFDGKVS